MALIVEDGSGLANAQSYVASSDADTYFTNRGEARWTGTTLLKEQALLRACTFLDNTYRERWKGRKNTKAQALTWPRWGVSTDGSLDDYFYPGYGTITSGFITGTTEIPQQLKDAQCELGLKELLSPGVLAPDIDPGASAITMEKVGPIEVSYAHGRVPYTIWRYVDQLLAPYCLATGMNRVLVRS